MYRLKIDLRATSTSLREEHDFESESAAESYYREVRAELVRRAGRIESRSSISEFLGGSQAQFWSVRRHFEENVKREFVWWKK
jgi:hypothetical protein